MPPRVALARDALAMPAAVEPAVKEAGDFAKAEGLVAGHRLAPRTMVGWAKIRGLPARGTQSMTRAGIRSQSGLSSESPSTLPDAFVIQHTQPGNVGMDEAQ